MVQILQNIASRAGFRLLCTSQCFLSWKHLCCAAFMEVTFVRSASSHDSLVINVNVIWFSFFLAKVRNFNRTCPVPDALLGSHHMGGSVGLTQRGADMAELFEKQVNQYIFIYLFFISLTTRI